jgi:hypothetical protein
MPVDAARFRAGLEAGRTGIVEQQEWAEFGVLVVKYGAYGKPVPHPVGVGAALYAADVFHGAFP